MNSGEFLTETLAFTAPVHRVCFAENDLALVTANRRNDVRVWDNSFAAQELPCSPGPEGRGSGEGSGAPDGLPGAETLRKPVILNRSYPQILPTIQK